MTAPRRRLTASIKVQADTPEDLLCALERIVARLAMEDSPMKLEYTYGDVHDGGMIRVVENESITSESYLARVLEV